MARARNIKPSFFTNEDLGTEDPLVGLLFIGLWCLADREGRLEDRPRKIKAELFPYRDRLDVDSMLSLLAHYEFILRYEIDGSKYIQVLKFGQHQSPHHLESPSKIPPPLGTSNRFNHTPIGVPQRRRIYDRDGHRCVLCGATEKLTIDHIRPVSKGGDSDDSNLRTLCQTCNYSKGSRAHPKHKMTSSQPHRKESASSSKPHDDNHGLFRPDSLIPDSLIPDSLIPECGNMNPDSLNPESFQENEKAFSQTKAKKKGTSSPAYSDDFEMFWEVYPRVRRENKAEAWKAWKKAIGSALPYDLIQAAKEYGESPLGSGEYSCMPATFLNKRKWEDDRSSWQRSDQKKTFAQIREENTDAAGERFEERWRDNMGLLEGLQ